MIYCAEVEIRDFWNDEYNYVTVRGCSPSIRDKAIQSLQDEHGDHNIEVLKQWAE